MRALVDVVRWSASLPDRLDPPPFGSFSSWSRMVREPLVRLGWPDPVASQQGLRDESDPEEDAFGALLRLWEKCASGPATALDVLLWCRPSSCPLPALSAEVAEAVEGLCGVPCGSEKAAQRLGLRVRSRAGRRHGGLRLVVADRSNKGRAYRIERDGGPRPPAEAPSMAGEPFFS